MQRDKLYGLIIFVGAAVILFWYTLYALVYAGFFHGGGRTLPDPWYSLATLWGALSYWGWAVILPIWVAALLILVIAMWIGWTMLTVFGRIDLKQAKPLHRYP